MKISPDTYALDDEALAVLRKVIAFAIERNETPREYRRALRQLDNGLICALHGDKYVVRAEWFTRTVDGADKLPFATSLASFAEQYAGSPGVDGIDHVNALAAWLRVVAKEIA